MATYNIASKSMGNNKPGKFMVFAELDFAKHNAAANDIFRLIKLKNGWIVTDSYYKVKSVGTSGTDWEVGVKDATTGIVDITDPTSTTAWAQGAYQQDGAAEFVPAEDEYIEVKVTAGAETIGKLLVAVEIFAGIDESETDSVSD
jgi:hypothetical protein